MKALMIVVYITTNGVHAIAPVTMPMAQCQSMAPAIAYEQKRTMKKVGGGRVLDVKVYCTPYTKPKAF